MIILDSKKYSEDELREYFIEYLRSVGIKEIAKEVILFNGNNVDVVYIDKKRKFVCVELKLTDWKKVIQQAVLRLNVTPFVYIAMPVPKTWAKRKRVEDAIEQTGLGLIWLKDGKQWITQFMPKEHKNNKAQDYFSDGFERSLYYNIHTTFLAKCIDYRQK